MIRGEDSQIISKPPTTLTADMVELTSLHVSGGVAVASGSLTADTYPGTGQIEITGEGVLNLLYFYVTDTTSRDVTIKIEVDGTQIIEDSLSTITTANSGGILVGMGTNSMGAIALDQIPFSSSLKIFLKSSVTETDKCYLKYIARLT